MHSLIHKKADGTLVYKDIEVLRVLDHPNIIKLYEVFQDSEDIYLVQEFCEGGELFDYIVDKSNLNERDTARIIKQIISAVHYCHDNGICHRNLKPDKIILSTKEQGFQLMISGFYLGESIEYLDDDKKKDFRMDTRAGTCLYMAPEVFKKNYSNAGDTWSIGVILYIMLSGLLPFEGSTDAEIEENIKSLNFDFDDEVWNTVSDEAKDLIFKTLTYESERITLKQILNHPWVKNMTDENQNIDQDEDLLDRLRQYKNASNFK